MKCIPPPHSPPLSPVPANDLHILETWPDITLCILTYLSMGQLAAFCRVSLACMRIGNDDRLWQRIAAASCPCPVPENVSPKAWMKVHQLGVYSGRLIEASLAGKYSEIAGLIARGANPNITDPHTGFTPAHCIARPRAENAPNTLGSLVQINAMCALLQAGANPDAPSRSGETPLHLAAQAGNFRELKVLLLARANPNARDNSGNTPLHGAAECGLFPAAGELLEAGARFDVTNAAGEAPLDVALRHGHELVASLLDDRPAHPPKRRSSEQIQSQKKARH